MNAMLPLPKSLLRSIILRAFRDSAGSLTTMDGLSITEWPEEIELNSSLFIREEVLVDESPTTRTETASYYLKGAGNSDVPCPLPYPYA